MFDQYANKHKDAQSKNPFTSGLNIEKPKFSKEEYGRYVVRASQRATYLTRRCVLDARDKICSSRVTSILFENIRPKIVSTFQASRGISFGHTRSQSHRAYSSRDFGVMRYHLSKWYAMSRSTRYHRHNVRRSLQHLYPHQRQMRWSSFKSQKTGSR